MQKANSGDTVKVHYEGKLEDGTLFDTSKDHDPLEFTIGQNQVIPGFEKAIIGMNIGESKTINIESEEAYGDYSDKLIHKVDRSLVSPDLDITVGQQLQMTSSEKDNPIIVKVIKITDDFITLDANHPLAGENLVFDITLVEITPGA